ncbi:hypothetical protein BDR22DRAFT_822165 [Usnea florida]
MSWNFDRFHDRTESLKSKITCSGLDSGQSRLSTIPLDIFENFLDRLSRRDAFQPSRTCRTLISHSSVLKAVFCEPTSLQDLQEWCRHLRSPGLKTKKKVGPPVTWGITNLTGPLVRRMAIPEWTSLQVLKYVFRHCLNLHAIDLTESFQFGPKDAEQYSDGVLYSESDDDWDPDGNGIRHIAWAKLIDLLGLTEQPQLPHILYQWRQNGLVELFKRLRSIHLPCGYWKTIWSRYSLSKESRSVCLPPLLRLASHLESLELSCQKERNRRPSPGARRQTSTRLLTEILENPRTQRLYGLENVTDPILSNAIEDHEHDTTSVLQYLSTLKKINDRGRMSLVSSDTGEDHCSTPQDYYGLCHTEMLHKFGDRLWTPVWTWEDYLNSVESRQDRSVNTLDIKKCRSPFEELSKAQYPVSLELKPLNDSHGAFFALLMDQSTMRRRYDGSDDVGDIVNEYFQTAIDDRSTPPVTEAELRATQQFVQQSVMTTIT